MNEIDANYGIKLDCDPIKEGYLLVGDHPEFGYTMNACKMADFLRLNNVLYLDKTTHAFYQGRDYRGVNVSDIILRALPPRENGLPYYVSRKSLEETVELWKQGWISNLGEWEIVED